MHQITAFGGLKGPAPFQQAIIQSPAFQNLPSSFQQQKAFQRFLSLLNVKSIAEARKLPSSVLIAANAVQVGLSDYGFFSFGPVVDGTIAPAMPGRLLLQGSFDKRVNVMVGHNANEGLFFTDPVVLNDSAYKNYVERNFLGIDPSVVTYLQDVLYPSNFDGSQGYKDQIGRAALTIADASFQ